MEKNKDMKKTVRKSKSVSSIQKSSISLLDKWNKKIQSIQERNLLIVFLLLTLVVDILNFNMKISEAHDDALYIEAAYRFIHEFPNYFYTANAPLYPLFLATLMKLFGFKLYIFKAFNILFHLGTVYFMFQTFKKIIAPVFFVFVMLFLSINYLMVYFSSMTFTEQMFMFIQSGLFYFMSQVILNEENIKVQNNNNKLFDVKNILLLALFVFLLNITRNISVSALPAVLIFMYFLKSYRKKILLFLGSYAALQILFKLLIKIIWGAASTNQYGSQSKILLQKDPYDATQGYDNWWGFIERFFGNTELYFSKRFFQILGLKDELNTNTNMFIPIIMWVLIFWAIWVSFKDRKYLITFVGLYILALLSSTFLVLQTRWDQPRFVLIAMPSMMILYFYLIEKYFKSVIMRNISFILVLVLSTSLMISNIKRTVQNFPVFLKNLNGDIYYGYTPDWINFLKASEWCGNNLPPEAYVASRKAPMSFIYGKRKFFPIYSVIKKDPETNQSNPDSALIFFQQNKVTHILMPRLRIDPTKNTGQYINTIDNILEPIQNKYPNKLKLIHTEGEVEPCYVFEFVYDAK